MENESFHTFLCQDVLVPLRNIWVWKVAAVAYLKS